MIRIPLRPALFAGGLALFAGLPLLGRSVRGGGTERCALDGVPVAAATRVHVVDAPGSNRAFCCVDCAGRWLRTAGGRHRGAFVTDESTGSEVPAGSAWFVESRVPAFAPCRSHVHVFALEADARRHAEAFGGFVLEGDERPLRPRDEVER